jgi:large subunit ribosomal protein L6
MSRVAKAPIEIPAGVEVSIKDSTMAVKGKLGQMEMEIHPSVVIANISVLLTYTRKLGFEILFNESITGLSS